MLTCTSCIFYFLLTNLNSSLSASQLGYYQVDLQGSTILVKACFILSKIRLPFLNCFIQRLEFCILLPLFSVSYMILFDYQSKYTPKLWSTVLKIVLFHGYEISIFQWIWFELKCPAKIFHESCLHLNLFEPRW